MARSWLARTGQRGRLVMPGLLAGAAVAALVRWRELSAAPPGGLEPAGALVAAAVFAALAVGGLVLSVRCLARGALAVPAFGWWGWVRGLARADRYPACGDPGASSP